LTALALGILFIDQKYYSLPNTSTNLLVGNQWAIAIAIVATILVIPIVLYWWYEVYTDKRYSVPVKISIPVFFLILLFWISQNIKLNTGFVDWFNPNSGLALAYFLFMGPAIAYIMAILIDLFASFYYLLRVVFGGINSLHEPLPVNKIGDLLSKDIPTNEEGKTWRILKLSENEIQTMSKWAVANREATEKRIIPITVGLSLFSLLTFGEFIQQNADGFIAEYVKTLMSIYSSPFSLNPLTVFVNIGLFLLILITILLVTDALVRLFVNLAVQNIIKTCLVAEYGNTED
jgi:hypothetical protein